MPALREPTLRDLLMARLQLQQGPPPADVSWVQPPQATPITMPGALSPPPRPAMPTGVGPFGQPGDIAMPGLDFAGMRPGFVPGSVEQPEPPRQPFDPGAPPWIPSGPQQRFGPMGGAVPGVTGPNDLFGPVGGRQRATLNGLFSGESLPGVTARYPVPPPPPDQTGGAVSRQGGGEIPIDQLPANRGLGLVKGMPEYADHPRGIAPPPIRAALQRSADMETVFNRSGPSMGPANLPSGTAMLAMDRFERRGPIDRPADPANLAVDPAEIQRIMDESKQQGAADYAGSREGQLMAQRRAMNVQNLLNLQDSGTRAMVGPAGGKYANAREWYDAGMPKHEGYDGAGLMDIMSGTMGGSQAAQRLMQSDPLMRAEMHKRIMDNRATGEEQQAASRAEAEAAASERAAELLPAYQAGPNSFNNEYRRAHGMTPLTTSDPARQAFAAQRRAGEADFRRNNILSNAQARAQARKMRLGQPMQFPAGTNDDSGGINLREVMMFGPAGAAHLADARAKMAAIKGEQELGRLALGEKREDRLSNQSLARAQLAQDGEIARRSAELQAQGMSQAASTAQAKLEAEQAMHASGLSSQERIAGDQNMYQLQMARDANDVALQGQQSEERRTGAALQSGERAALFGAGRSTGYVNRTNPPITLGNALNGQPGPAAASPPSGRPYIPPAADASEDFAGFDKIRELGADYGAAPPSWYNPMGVFTRPPRVHAAQLASELMRAYQQGEFTDDDIPEVTAALRAGMDPTMYASWKRVAKDRPDLQFLRQLLLGGRIADLSLDDDTVSGIVGQRWISSNQFSDPWR